MVKPFKAKIGKGLTSDSTPGKSASAPGQLKKAAGAQSAKAYTKKRR